MRTCSIKCGPQLVADNAQLAETFFERLRGLLGKPGLGPSEALIIPHCRSVHMFFMRFAIDVVFCDRNGGIVFLMENLKPWRFSPVILGAELVVELPAGAIKAEELKIGDKLTFV